MIGILFVCHGNICRSTMAESVFAHILKKHGVRNVTVSSAATHSDEIGNPPHRGTREKLAREGVPLIPHRARLLTRADGERYDFIIGMDAENLRHIRRILGESHAAEIALLLDYASRPRAIADPWYTGDFDATYRDVTEGCEALYEELRRRGLIESHITF